MSFKTSKEDLIFVYPDMFNVPTTVEWLFNHDLPYTFNVPLLFVIFEVAVPDTLNDDMHVVALDTSKLEKFVLFNNDVDIACKFEMFKFEYVDNEYKLLKWLLM